MARSYNYILVHWDGFEPPSRRASTDRSTLLSYQCFVGADGEYRPHNLLFTKQLLCHLSHISVMNRGRYHTAHSWVYKHCRLTTLPRHFTQSALLKNKCRAIKKALTGNNQTGLSSPLKGSGKSEPFNDIH
jgi:hypothetical protein